MDSKLRGMAIYRSAFFYPVMIPSVAAGMLWVFLYAPGYGPINEALTSVGLPRLDWLYDSNWALPAIVIMSVWKYSGYFMLILLAALKLVPSDLYEAARLDGVGAWHRLIHITIPLISPTLYFVIIIGTLHSYQIFDYVYVMTQCGPADSTNVLTYYIYQNGFQYQDIGYASALANALLVFVLGLIGLVAVTLGRKVHYLGER
jgi:multiple sugar transport system permease protein/sn-glycerol 3-phosphate transport system permease protein